MNTAMGRGWRGVMIIWTAAEHNARFKELYIPHGSIR